MSSDPKFTIVSKELAWSYLDIVAHKHDVIRDMMARKRPWDARCYPKIHAKSIKKMLVCAGIVT
jgi:hypothetical protein